MRGSHGPCAPLPLETPLVYIYINQSIRPIFQYLRFKTLSTKIQASRVLLYSYRDVENTEKSFFFKYVLRRRQQF